jgi:molecular chaperone Hsp33
MNAPAVPSRPVSDAGADDVVLPYAVEPLSLRGRLVRLGPAVDAILKRHDYPAPIARVVGEAIALTILLGTALKGESSFQLQTKSDGVLQMLVVDFDAPSNVRALARFDAERFAKMDRAARSGDLLGSGHLAFTIDPGGDMARYQGVVALDGQGLEEAAHQYFLRSEQIPTLVRLAVGETITQAGSHWRAGGLVAQFLPDSPERRRQADLDPGDAPPGVVVDVVEEDDHWTEARALAATIEDHELLDPTLSSERLLYRLFHERGVKVFAPSAVRDVCRCSAERIDAMLRSFTPQERADMVGDDGMIGVTCEFCSTKRVFDPVEYDAGPPGASLDE